MKMKKVLVLLLVLCFGLSVLAGCGGTGTSTDAAASSVAAPADTAVDAAASGDAVAPTGETVKLTALFTKHPLTKELAKMEWLQKAEADAGVEIAWEEITSDWPQKKAALLAGGDIPDLVVGNNAILDTEFAQFPGLFEDLSPLLNKYAPNVLAMFSDHPETKVIATQLDGKIYGLPKYQRYWPATVTRQYINQNWLDKLGMAVPTNWDELFNVLTAFKEKDANGNGDPNDEIPMDFAPPGGSFGFFQPTVLMGSMGITLSDSSGNGQFVEGGKVKSFLTDERYKTLVQFLNKCFKAGLINKEVFTQDYTKFQSVARGNGDVAAVGFSWGWDVTDRFGNALAPQYTSMGQLKQSASSTSKLSWDYDYNILNYGMNCIQMSAQCSNKEAAMKFINQLYDPIVSMQVLFGSIGPNIKDNGDGSYSILPPEDPKMDPGTWKWTSSWADNGPMNIADSLKLTLGTDMQSIDKQMDGLKPIIESIDKDNDVLPAMFMKYTVDENATMGTNNTNVMTVAMAKFAQWITTGGIENEWDDYVKNLEKAGLKQNLEIIQKNYDGYKSK